MPAPAASGGSGRRAGLAPAGKAPPYHGARGLRTFAPGFPLMVVARNLGHADTRMVEKHYGHLATSYVREAIRAAKPLGIGRAAKVVPIAGAR